MVINDLNELSSSRGKFAKHQGNSTQLNKFKKMLDENGFVDVDNIRLPYT